MEINKYKYFRRSPDRSRLSSERLFIAAGNTLNLQLTIDKCLGEGGGTTKAV